MWQTLPSLSTYSTPILVLSLLTVTLYLFLRRPSTSSQRPPGPKGLPFIGNYLQIPNDRQWLKWAEWSDTYGDVMMLDIFGSRTLVLSSLKAARDLLESRGRIYSDRPRAVMAGELVGWDQGLGYSQGPPNARFREFRKMMHQFMGPRACSGETLMRAQERENVRLLEKLLEDPVNFYDHCRTSTSSTILALTYGYDAGSSDPLNLVKIAEDAMAGFSLASEPVWVVDSLPFLRHLPPWFPGASFNLQAAQMRRDLKKLYDVPFNFVVDALATGHAKSSFVADNLSQSSDFEDKDGLIRACAASLYSGGAETSPSALTSFILAMVLNSDIAKKAQQQLDAYLTQHSADSYATNPSRLPRIDDRPHLPYIDSIVKEIWRWNPSVPLGLPHVVTQDDVYRGWTIPKGTVVWTNIWAILHDQSVFPDPTKFDPDRYIRKDGSVDENGDAAQAVGAAFGFGRRICPGLYLAENSVFVAIATMLSCFDIGKSTEHHPEVEYDGFISHPRPFKCVIEPRSKEVEAFLRRRIDELGSEDRE